jgi:hypothetical protein
MIKREVLEKYSQQVEPRNGAGAAFDIFSYIEKHHFEVLRAKPWNSHPGGAIIELAACPFNPDHVDGSAAFSLLDGVPGFTCQHNGCEGKNIKDVFERFPPGPEPVYAKLSAHTIVDMPGSVLDGWLGDVCQKYLLKLSPMAYAWPALVTVAGTLAHKQSQLRSNLFSSLIGPVGSGKTATVDNALAILGLNNESPEIKSMMAGSAEGLFKDIGDANGCARLYSPDELKHLFLKIQIEGSPFAQVLQRAYYQTRFEMIIAKGKKFQVDVSLGILGGLVDFEECYTSTSMAGLYDRTIFGLCPEPFRYDYEPFEHDGVNVPTPAPVKVHHDVWEARNDWLKTVPGMTGRIAENALRVASICAGFNSKSLLRATDLGPALEFAKYQIRFRALKQPNPGQNPEAVCAFAILRKLAEFTPGEYVAKRKILHAIHAEKFGPGISRRAGENLFFNGEIDRWFGGTTKKAEFWKLSGEDEGENK